MPAIVLDTKYKRYADDSDMARIAQQGKANNQVRYYTKLHHTSVPQR